MANRERTSFILKAWEREVKPPKVNGKRNQAPGPNLFGRRPQALAGGRSESALSIAPPMLKDFDQSGLEQNRARVQLRTNFASC
jgi:hypothetical protein